MKTRYLIRVYNSPRRQRFLVYYSQSMVKFPTVIAKVYKATSERAFKKRLEGERRGDAVKLIILPVFGEIELSSARLHGTHFVWTRADFAAARYVVFAYSQTDR
jgi:hypothetical protein